MSVAWLHPKCYWARNAAQAAEANVRASESPTQARSYEEARDSALAQLRDSQVQYTQFINSWRGVCSELGGKKCEYGA